MNYNINENTLYIKEKKNMEIHVSMKIQSERAQGVFYLYSNVK